MCSRMSISLCTACDHAKWCNGAAECDLCVDECHCETDFHKFAFCSGCGELPVCVVYKDKCRLIACVYPLMGSPVMHDVIV